MFFCCRRDTRCVVLMHFNSIKLFAGCAAEAQRDILLTYAAVSEESELTERQREREGTASYNVAMWWKFNKLKSFN